MAPFSSFRRSNPQRDSRLPALQGPVCQPEELVQRDFLEESVRREHRLQGKANETDR